MISRAIGFLLAGVLAAGGVGAQDLLVKGGRVYSGKDGRARRRSVLVKDGRIVKVGAVRKTDPMIPEIDATGRWITPGFVLAQTSEGLYRPNENVEVVPYLSVIDNLDPASRFFEDSLRDGHLTMLVLPGDRTVIGGMGRIVHPYGLTVEDMTVVAEPGLKISLIPKSGNRAAHVARLRRELDKARNALERLGEDGSLEKLKPTGNWDVDLAAMGVKARDRALLRLLKRDLRAYVSCGTAGDVVQALRLAGEYGFDMRLVCHPGTWRAASYLASRKVPVILTSKLEVEEPDPETGEPVRRVIPKIFHDAGVEFAVCSSTSGLGERYLWYQACSLVRYGIPKDVAFRAITSTPARLIGVGDRKGTLEEGRDGDLLILTDDPFSGQAWVDRAVIAGRVVYDRRQDPRLAEVFEAGSR